MYELNSTTQKKIIKLEYGKLNQSQDLIAVEKFIDIYVNQRPFLHSTYMPGQEKELGLGILFSTQKIIDISQVNEIEFNNTTSRLDIYIDSNKNQQIGRKSPPFHQVCLKQLNIANSIFLSKTESFKKTGCVHSCLLLSSTFKQLGFGEDVGRHNAFDKAVGELILRDKIDEAYIAIISSRISFEIIQKAIVLGIGILAGVSAPTSLAIEKALDNQITLIGFFREHRMNIYTYPKRIKEV